MTKKFKSGFVTIIGRPNVGKSTFMNYVLGDKISIATSKPQTTRDRILGVYDDDENQIVFLDTPGVHESEKELNRYMLDQALSSLADADLVMLMVEPRDSLKKLAFIAENVKNSGKETILVLNKRDELRDEMVGKRLMELAELGSFSEHVAISASKGTGVETLMEIIKARMPEGPRYFPPDMLTDLSMRFLTQELIREKIFTLTHQEVPYSVAVQVEKFKEGKTISISATIHVEKPAQKAIIIGKGGQKLKEIGTRARKDIERMTGSKVFLELFVRVTKDWTKNPRVMRDLGYN